MHIYFDIENSKELVFYASRKDLHDFASKNQFAKVWEKRCLLNGLYEINKWLQAVRSLSASKFFVLIVTFYTLGEFDLGTFAVLRGRVNSFFSSGRGHRVWS